MLKNKILILFIVMLCVFGFLCSSAYATTDTTYTFTGFDDLEYNLPSLPDSVTNCKNYIICSFETGAYTAIGFNSDVNVTFNGNLINIDTVDNSVICVFSLSSSGDDNWTKSPIVNPTHFHSSSACSVIDSSEDLYVYKAKFIAREDFFAIPFPVVVTPIVKEIPLEGVLQEILEILPVVLMTIVGLIGLRKALKFLSMVLHRS